MTDTVLSSASKEVAIGFDRPFVVIGERINPTGRKLLAEEMKNGDYSRVQSDALEQVTAGAQVLDVNAGIPLSDEPAILAECIKLIQSITDVPLCIRLNSSMSSSLRLSSARTYLLKCHNEKPIVEIRPTAATPHAKDQSRVPP